MSVVYSELNEEIEGWTLKLISLYAPCADVAEIVVSIIDSVPPSTGIGLHDAAEVATTNISIILTPRNTMSSPPAGPVKRLGPKFAVINDVDREIEEELDLAGSEPPKHVDDEIDELLSDNDNDDEMDGVGGSGSAMKAVGGTTRSHHDGLPEWTCRWDDCFRDLVGQEALVEHVQNGELFRSFGCDERIS